jgi:capsular exopolysaccharide synthesis family protein
MSLAQSGQRVLLMDADLRKPRAHTMFKRPQEPGLSNVLVGTARASESVRATSTAGLWLLPAGKMSPNPTELMGSARFEEFLSSLEQHFDWIIIDTPPVMAVIDPSVIAHLAAGVLFVVGAEMTSRHAAKHALAQLRRVNARIIGGVLNRVDLKHQSYYYSEYYRREYATYYRDE